MIFKKLSRPGCLDIWFEIRMIKPVVKVFGGTVDH